MSAVPFEQRAHRVILYDDCVFPLTNTGEVAEVNFVDPEEGPSGLLAFSFSNIFHNPDISRVRREDAWAGLKPDVSGPRDALLEWGPGQTLGSIAFGSRPRGTMASWINKKRDASRVGKVSRYFSIQGSEYKWKIDSERWECVDSAGRSLAVWTRVQDNAMPNYHGKLVVHDAGYLVITEIVATLVLNRIAAVKGW
ncbi:hypothetical protein EXIGLDRAFT_717606 [Exidia glandulosa HHB12029]|uniref:Uncharacterized protein n=1 Tax=Exidia glandulosa HHB12029 TaxID=1314781 RepID=A0A165I8X7_EXIGL|nr:hypothetical protein EXIGLDRAFT_717606 [Exidia glandulosa HHB12029]